MNKKVLLVIVILIGLAFAAVILTHQPQRAKTDVRQQASHTQHQVSPQASATRPATRIPAHYETAPSLSSLGPTLPPEQFLGKTREAYKVVREIPQTIAQLPCYCHCDTGFGHKSLYSCFEDNHASQCAVCVDEALLAYQLQKKERLTGPQIRQRIVAQYSAER